MNGSRYTPGKVKKFVRNFRWKSIKEREHLWDLSIDGRMVLRRIIKKEDMRVSIGFIQWWAFVSSTMNLQNPNILLISWAIISLSGSSLLSEVQLFISFHLLSSSCHQLNELKLTRSRDNSVGIATGYRLNDGGFDSRYAQEIYILSTAARPTSESRPAVHTPRAAVRQGWWSTTSTSLYILLAWCLVI
jgi:hypothetical protein